VTGKYWHFGVRKGRGDVRFVESKIRFGPATFFAMLVAVLAAALFLAVVGGATVVGTGSRRRDR
jgi:hypothetical protein